MIGRILCWASSEGFVTDSLAVLGLSGVEQRVSGWRLVFLPRLRLQYLAGWCTLGTESATGPLAPGPPAPPLTSSPARPGSEAPCSGPGSASAEAPWAARARPNRPLLPLPQLRRSPIKKVRKSLALDVVDEDGKLMMSTLPKALSVVRGLGEAVPSPELQRLFSPREKGGLSLGLCPWDSSCLEDLQVAQSGGSQTGLPGSWLSREGLIGSVGLGACPGFHQRSAAPGFSESFIWQQLYLLEHI